MAMARGSITPRPMKDGKIRYRVKWESTWPDGRRRHHSATRLTKKDAEKFLACKLGEVNDGTFVVATKATVAEFFERWLAALSPGWSEATAYEYGCRIRGRILPH